MLIAILREVVLRAFRVRLHGSLARLPASGADLAVLVGELESLQQPQRLVHASPHREIVDRDLPQLSERVDYKESSEGETLILLQDAVGAAYGHTLVGQQGNLHLAQAALLAGLLAPGEVGELRISAAGHHRTVQGLELRHPVREGDDLSRADEGEVQRIEEEDHIFPLVVFQRDFLELSVNHGSADEFRSLHLGL